MENWQQVGARIAERRESAHLTQGQLGKRIGSTAKMVKAYESGERIPVNALKKIANTLDCTVWTLLIGETPKPQRPNVVTVPALPEPPKPKWRPPEPTPLFLLGYYARQTLENLEWGEYMAGKHDEEQQQKEHEAARFNCEKADWYRDLCVFSGHSVEISRGERGGVPYICALNIDRRQMIDAGEWRG